MTDIDIDRCTHGGDCQVHPDARGLHNYDADALSTKVDELTTERNTLLRELAETTAALTKSREQAATYANEVGRLTAENARVRQQRDAHTAVVEAAKALVKPFPVTLTANFGALGEAMVAAVDALPKAEAAR